MTTATKPAGPALTGKQEAFCLAYIEMGDASKAYRASYDAGKMSPDTVNRKAAELMKNGRIAARIADLRAPAVERAQVSLEQHLMDLHRLRDAALVDGKYGAAIAAEIARGKAAGLYITKVEDVTDPLKKAMGNMTPEQAERVLAALDQAEAALRKKPTRAGTR